MRRLLPAALFLISVLVVLPAAAQRQKSIIPELDEDSRKGEMARRAQHKANEKFDEADEDRNGMISKAEAARHLPYFADNFSRYDKDGDGQLNWEEFIGHDHWQRQPPASR